MPADTRSITCPRPSPRPQHLTKTMPPKKRKREKSPERGCSTISSYFKASDKKNIDEPPDSKKTCLSTSNLETTPTSDQQLSPVQRQQVVSNKMDAEAKLWAKKLGAGSLGASWMRVLSVEFKKDYFTKLLEFVQSERTSCTVYPPAVDVFSWTTACRMDDVKVVILGQDPYHGPNQAHGLCFSVRPGVAPPPSLVNIYKELANTVKGFIKPDHGYLQGWARQGVLLLNACLTVRAKQPNSHAKKGWEQFTDAVINWLNSHLKGLVFILWGAYAQKKGSCIDKKRHHVLTSVHPSPLSASKGFFGCKHFLATNEFLVKQGKTPIDWSLLPTDI